MTSRSTCNARRQMATLDVKEPELDESQVLEERLKDLLTTDKRGLNRPRNVFDNLNKEVPKLRRSIVTRAMQNVVCSTPMPTDKTRDFFCTENSLNISPINSISKELEIYIEHMEPSNNQASVHIDAIPNVHKEAKVVLERTLLPIIISDSSSEDENEVKTKESKNKTNKKIIINDINTNPEIKFQNKKRNSSNNEINTHKQQEIKNTSVAPKCQISDEVVNKTHLNSSKLMDVANDHVHENSKNLSSRNVWVNNSNYERSIRKDTLPNSKRIVHSTGNQTDSSCSDSATNNLNALEIDKNEKSYSEIPEKSNLHMLSKKSKHSSILLPNTSKSSHYTSNVRLYSQNETELKEIASPDRSHKNKTDQDDSEYTKLITSTRRSSRIAEGVNSKRNMSLKLDSVISRDSIIQTRSQKLADRNKIENGLSDSKNNITNRADSNSTPSKMSLRTEQHVNEKYLTLSHNSELDSPQKVSGPQSSSRNNITNNTKLDHPKRMSPRKLSFLPIQVSESQKSDAEFKYSEEKTSKIPLLRSRSKSKDKLADETLKNINLRARSKSSEQAHKNQNPKHSTKDESYDSSKENNVANKVNILPPKCPPRTKKSRLRKNLTDTMDSSKKNMLGDTLIPKNSFRNIEDFTQVSRKQLEDSLRDLEKDNEFNRSSSQEKLESIIKMKQINEIILANDKSNAERREMTDTNSVGKRNASNKCSNTLKSTEPLVDAGTSPFNIVFSKDSTINPSISHARLKALASKTYTEKGTSPIVFENQSSESRMETDGAEVQIIGVYDPKKQTSSKGHLEVCDRKYVSRGKTFIEVGTSPIQTNVEISRKTMISKKTVEASTTPCKFDNAANKEKEMYTMLDTKKANTFKQIVLKLSQNAPNSQNLLSNSTNSNIKNNSNLHNEQSSVHALSEYSLEKISRRVYREVQTSVKKNSQKNTPKRKSLARNIFNQNVVEQQTQTTSSVDKAVKAYTKRNTRINNRAVAMDKDESSRSSSMTDHSEILRDLEKEKRCDNMLFQSLVEGDMPPSFSSSDDEVFEDTLRSEDQQNHPWRLDDDIISLPRRSSYKLNFLRTAHDIEMERKSLNKQSNYIESDNELEERQLIKGKQKYGHNQSLVSTNNKNKLQVYTRGRQTSNKKNPHAGDSLNLDIQSKFNDCSEDERCSPGSIMSNLHISYQELQNRLENCKEKNEDLQPNSSKINMYTGLSDVNTNNDLNPEQNVNNCPEQTKLMCLRAHHNFKDISRSRESIIINKSNNDNSNTLTIEVNMCTKRDTSKNVNRESVERTPRSKSLDIEDNIGSINNQSLLKSRSNPSNIVQCNNNDIDNDERTFAYEEEHAKNESTNINQNTNEQSKSKPLKKNINNLLHNNDDENEDEILATPLEDSGDPQLGKEHVSVIENSNLHSVPKKKNSKNQLENKQNQESNGVKSCNKNHEVDEPAGPVVSVAKRQLHKPKTKTISESDDGVSSTTLDSKELTGLRRSARERKPTKRRPCGVVATYSEKILHYFNGGVSQSTDIFSTTTSKPRTKKKETSTKNRSTRDNTEIEVKKNKRGRKKKVDNHRTQKDVEQDANKTITSEILNRSSGHNEDLTVAKGIENKSKIDEINATIQGSCDRNKTSKKSPCIAASVNTINGTSDKESQDVIPKKRNKKEDNQIQDNTVNNSNTAVRLPRRSKRTNISNKAANLSENYINSSTDIGIDNNHISNVTTNNNSVDIVDTNYVDEGTNNHISNNDFANNNNIAINGDEVVNEDKGHQFSSVVMEQEGHTEHFLAHSSVLQSNNSFHTEEFTQLNKPSDKDSGRSSLLKSTTFEDSRLRICKPSTGRISKKYKKRGNDYSTKISKVLSRSINNSKEYEIFNDNNEPNTGDDACSVMQSTEDIRMRRSSIMHSKPVESDYINLFSNNEVIGMKYVDRNPNFKLVKDNLMVTDMIRNFKDGGTMGILRLAPGCQKPLHVARKFSLFYSVIDGEGFIQVHNRTSRIGKLSHFIIPLGIEYSIHNVSKEDCLMLAFVKVSSNVESHFVS